MGPLVVEGWTQNLLQPLVDDMKERNKVFFDVYQASVVVIRMVMDF